MFFFHSVFHGLCTDGNTVTFQVSTNTCLYEKKTGSVTESMSPFEKDICERKDVSLYIIAHRVFYLII